MADTNEGVDYLDDGRIRITWDGITRTLRRPRFGEFRDKFTTHEQMWADIKDLNEDDALKRLGEWLADALERFGDGPPPGEDEWPSWFAAPMLTAQILNHWRTVPLPSGGQPVQAATPQN